MNVLSLFDGMSCGQIALNKLGIKIDNYYASEIDKYAISVTQFNYPNTIQLGDVTKVNGFNLPKIDLLIGGSPCTGFSFAGKGLNFNDPQSKLFFEYVRILKEVKPTYFLLENVVMKKEHEEVITKYLGVEPMLINSSLVSAQNRRRLYWTNIPNITQPIDKGITWGDVREYGVNTQSYYYTQKAMQWLGRVSLNKNKLLTIHSNSDKMQMLEASHNKKYSNQRFFGIVDLPQDNSVYESMKSVYSIYETDGDIKFYYDSETKSINMDNRVPFTLPNRVSSSKEFLRYITPLECERLQNVPDNYSSCVSNTQRYRMLGNGWTVDVIAHIFSFLIY